MKMHIKRSESFFSPLSPLSLDTLYVHTTDYVWVSPSLKDHVKFLGIYFTRCRHFHWYVWGRKGSKWLYMLYICRTECFIPNTFKPWLVFRTTIKARPPLHTALLLPGAYITLTLVPTQRCFQENCLNWIVKDNSLLLIGLVLRSNMSYLMCLVFFVFDYSRLLYWKKYF